MIMNFRFMQKIFLLDLMHFSFLQEIPMQNCFGAELF